MKALSSFQTKILSVRYDFSHIRLDFIGLWKGLEKIKARNFLRAILLSIGVSTISFFSSPELSKVKAQTSTDQPLIILVNGQGDCCIQNMTNVRNYLRSINAEVYIVPWNSLYGEEESDNSLNDALFLYEAADYLNRVSSSRPVILIGHSFGADSLLKLFRVNDVRVNRRIDFLGVIDPVTTGGVRNPIRFYGVASNVQTFFNRWQTNQPWPIDINNSGSIQICQAEQCDQQEQSIARNADHSPITETCQSWEITCPGYQPWPGGSNGRKQKRLLHQAMPGDAYIQQQIIAQIENVLSTIGQSPTSPDPFKQIILATNTAPFPASTSSSYFLADINNDGVVDLVQIEPLDSGANVRVVSGEPINGQPFSQILIAKGTPQFPTSSSSEFALADVDNNGVVDLVQIEPLGVSGANVRVVSGESSFDRMIMSTTTTLFPASTSSSYFLADINNDGVVDLVQIEPLDSGANVRVVSGN